MTLTGGPVVGVGDARVARVRHARWRDPAVGALLGGVLAAVVSWLMHDALGDDALISVAYARTVAETGTWGVFPGLPANTQTSPLNVWLLATAIWAFGHPVVMVAALTCACVAAIGALAVVLARRLDLPPAVGWLAVALVGISPVLASTVGLEAYLGGAALLAVTAVAVAGRPGPTGAAVGIAVLVRPDLAVPAAALATLLVLVGRRRVRHLGTATVVALVVALPWHVFSWYALGGAVPDTTWVRTGDRTGAAILGAVPGWLRVYPAAGYGGLVPVALGLAAAALGLARRRERWARTAVVLVAAGWLHLLALQAIHAQGAGWYYAPVVVCSSMAAALGLAALVGQARVALTAGVAVLVSALAVITSPPLPWIAAPLVANMALTSQYAQIGGELSALTGGEPVEGPGELGALAFYAQVPVLDFLSEPAQTDRMMAARAAEGGLRARLMAWSSEHRESSTPIATRWRLTFVGSAPVPGRVVKEWPVVAPTGTRRQLVLLETTG